VVRTSAAVFVMYYSVCVLELVNNITACSQHNAVQIHYCMHCVSHKVVQRIKHHARISKH
jgi:hypothetical protein